NVQPGTLPPSVAPAPYRGAEAVAKGAIPRRCRSPRDRVRGQPPAHLAAWVGAAVQHARAWIDADAEDVAGNPVVLEDDRVAARGERVADGLRNAAFDAQSAGDRVVREEARREVRRREARRLDRVLHRHAELDEVQEHLQRPLILLIAALSAENHRRRAVAQHERRRERRPWALSGNEGVRVTRNEEERLHARPEREADTGD